MDWPQITYLSLQAIALFCAAVLDGQPKSGTHRFSVALFGSGISLWLLWMGGFFA